MINYQPQTVTITLTGSPRMIAHTLKFARASGLAVEQPRAERRNYIRVSAAARQLKVSRSTVYRAIDDGRIQFVEDQRGKGPGYRVDPSTFRQKSRRRAPAASPARAA